MLSMDTLLSCLRLLTKMVVKNRGKQIVSNGRDTLAAKYEKNEDPERLNQVLFPFIEGLTLARKTIVPC